MKKLIDVMTPSVKGFGSADQLPPGYGYNKKYRYKVNLYTYGVEFETMAWCWKHCKSAWGWYFIPKPNVEWAEDYENMYAILTFKSKKDFIYYRLTNA